MGLAKPAKEDLIAVLKAAKEAGTIAGNQRISDLASNSVSDGKLLEECGNSALRLDVDGRTRLGKLLASLEDRDFSISKDHGGGFLVHFRYNLELIPPVNGQEYSIDYEADKAAAKVIEERLGIKAFALPYIN